MIRKVNRHGGVSLINVEYANEVGGALKPLNVLRKEVDKESHSIGCLQVDGEDWVGTKMEQIKLEVDSMPFRPTWVMQ